MKAMAQLFRDNLMVISLGPIFRVIPQENAPLWMKDLIRDVIGSDNDPIRGLFLQDAVEAFHRANSVEIAQTVLVTLPYIQTPAEWLATNRRRFTFCDAWKKKNESDGVEELIAGGRMLERLEIFMLVLERFLEER